MSGSSSSRQVSGPEGRAGEKGKVDREMGGGQGGRAGGEGPKGRDKEEDKAKEQKQGKEKDEEEENKKKEEEKKQQDKEKEKEEEGNKSIREKITDQLGYAWSQLNWFRIHLLVFTFLPLIFSGFFMAANPSPSSGLFITSYLDGLFMCYSAMTVTGLNTVSVSETSRAQQAFLLVLMILGDISVVNLITIGCRQFWIRTECRDIALSSIIDDLHAGKKKVGPDASDAENGKGNEGGEGDGNGSGKIKERDTQEKEKQEQASQPSGQDKADEKAQGRVKGKDPKSQARSQESIDSGDSQHGQSDSASPSRTARSEDSRGESSSTNATPPTGGQTQSPPEEPWRPGFRRRHDLRIKSGQTSRQDDEHLSRSQTEKPHAASGRTINSGRGGFPSLFEISSSLARAILSSTASDRFAAILRKCEKEETVHASHPLQAADSLVSGVLKARNESEGDKDSQSASWLPPGVRGVVVGRNSEFYEEELSDEDLELVGTLEYKSTKVLTLLIVSHQLFWIFVPFAIIAIYFAKDQSWDSVFVANGSTQSGNVSKTWYSFFQVVSGYSSCGLSLVDLLMQPFQTNYLLVYVLIFPSLAGNQFLPLFLRFELWVATKLVPKGTQLSVSLHFIMTHSRRMFLYLIPAYQSFYLLGVEDVLMTVGTVAFVVLNHGTSYYATLGSGWEKFSIGLFQAVSARASGFDIISVSSLAPSLTFLYLILMFTSNYPLVMALRSTNVYEERALGLYGEHAPNSKSQHQSGEIFSKYLKHHLLPQIYFDLWPVAVGTLFVCIIERGQLMDPDNIGWLGVYQILFEVVSGYGTIGMSYGNPWNTSSLSSSFRTLSKLIIILIMLRGRHRGLPLAIDRAVMFPNEYQRRSRSGQEREKIEEDRVDEAGNEADAE